MHIVHPLEPVWDCHSRILVLGTMPSVKSRELEFYYMHPQNRFWKWMSHALDETYPETVAQKTDMVLRHGIALWDVLESCEIEGSSDASIKNVRVNDFSLILQQSQIRHILTTGAAASSYYRRFAEEKTGFPCVGLPSSSPANRSQPEALQMALWKETIQGCLRNEKMI